MKEIDENYKRVVLSQQWIDEKLILRLFLDQEEMARVENPDGTIFRDVNVYSSKLHSDSVEGQVDIKHLKISDKSPPSSKLSYIVGHMSETAYYMCM